MRLLHPRAQAYSAACGHAARARGIVPQAQRADEGKTEAPTIFWGRNIETPPRGITSTHGVKEPEKIKSVIEVMPRGESKKNTPRKIIGR